MLYRVLIATLGAAILVLSAAAMSASAWSGELEGGPQLTDEMPAGYYLWHNDDGLHLRTHGPGAEHDFTARLVTDGVFEDVDAVRLENKDNYALVDGGHVLVMNFRTFRATDGLNFRIRGGTKLHLNLRLDGTHIGTDSIFLGKDGDHPDKNPFTLYRDPDRS